jgi:KipI family sensor histidine kinase inhibitor
MRFLPAGDRAVLVELDSLAEVHRLHREVRLAGIAVDSVPGWSTLLVTTDGRVDRLVESIQELATGPVHEPLAPAVHTIPVAYDGADLADVAAACALSVVEVVRLHAGAEYVVAFLGFARGFPYLAGLPAELHLPRRDTPRPRVPAGSVAIAFDQCGVYPTASPGGWHLLGTTTAQLFDPADDPPTALAPGDLVRFVDVTGSP